MKTYDEVVGFDYTNSEEWRSFVKNQIAPLHKSVSKLIKLRKTLENLLSNDFSDLIRNSTNIKQILLGGVDENGDYKPNSLANIYKEFLGISINTKEWASLSKQPDIDATEYVKCNFTSTSFLKFANYIKEITDRLLFLAEIGEEEVKDDEIRDLLENPEKIVNELKELYARVIAISANHSYYTFFTINTRCIPRYYIEQAYPKLEYKFEKVAEFLGLEPKFIPDIKEKEIKRNYTLWGHTENGFADLLYELNRIIWEYFGEEDFRKLFGIIASDAENLRQRYYDKVKKSLDRIGWKFPRYIRKSDPPSTHHRSGVAGPYSYTYNINGIMLTSYSWYGISARGYQREGKDNCNISLIQLFNDISPCLFFGLCNLYIDSKKLRVW